MPLDPRTPVLVATGQISQRVDRGEPVVEPVDLMAEAARRGAADAGSASLLAAVDTAYGVLSFSWRYRNVGLALGERLGAEVRRSFTTTASGSSPQMCVNRAALDIAAGRAEVVLIAGAETWRTSTAARAAGEKPDWTVQGEDVPPAELAGGEFSMMDELHTALGFGRPVDLYPLFEQALRIKAGRSIEDHLVRISELWSRFSAIAATNPYAWIQRPMTAEEIRTPGPQNRWIGFPYTKVMNSNNNVEQGAALVLCSAEAAQRHGIAPDHWVFPLAGTEAHDIVMTSNRAELYESPAIRTAGRTVFELAGLGLDDVAHVDLYSCFPSAVQVSAAELGLPIDDPARPLTVTGGMSFAGGPWNNYVSHSIAAMAGVLRADPGTIGLVTANGGMITKHAIGLYSTTPPADGFRHADVQDEVDGHPSREAVADHAGPGTVETWTVMHGRDGEPELGIVAVRTPDGRRAWGVSREPTTLTTLVTEDVAGAAVALDGAGALSL